MSLRRWARAATPYVLRARLARTRRALADAVRRERFAKPACDAGTTQLVEQVRLRQPIRPGCTIAGKLANIRLAASRIERVILREGEVFSFWSAVGAPTRANGYAIGRAIVADRLDETVGGGLCQLSGALYELALRGGLNIVERRAHSHDLYDEAERFTPLGLDATVVFGFTDLRFRNLTGTDVAFRFRIDNGELTASLHASAPLAPCELRLKRRDVADGGVEAEVERIGSDGIVRDQTLQRYARLSGHSVVTNSRGR